MNVVSQKIEEKQKQKAKKIAKIVSLNKKLFNAKINKYSRLIPLLIVVILSLLSLFLIPDYVQDNDFGTYISNIGTEGSSKINTVIQLDNSSIGRNNSNNDIGTDILNMFLLYLASIILFSSCIIYIWTFGKKVNLRIDSLTREIDYQKRYDT
jgi:hypothetical protein